MGKGIDFNDLHQEQGLNAVRDCIANAYIPARPVEESRIKLFHWSELGMLPKRKPLIKGVLDCNAMSVLYGESNTGKTFLALDMCIAIAIGNPWLARNVKQGSVVYVATESGIGIVERLTAFHIHNRMNDLYPPLYLVPVGIDLCSHSADTEELIEKVQELDNVQVIVIDTLSRALSGGNENSPEDMGSFIKNCDMIREATGSHILIIHHSGKDQARGSRGHSSLKGAVDTEIELKQSQGAITAEIKKQRDGKTGDKFYFNLQTVKIGVEDDGDDITSCVLAPLDEKPFEVPALSPQAQRAQEVLLELVDKEGEKRVFAKGLKKGQGLSVMSVCIDAFKESLRASGISDSDNPDTLNKAIRRSIQSLKKAGIIELKGEYVFVIGQGGR